MFPKPEKEQASLSTKGSGKIGQVSFSSMKVLVIVIYLAIMLMRSICRKKKGCNYKNF